MKSKNLMNQLNIKIMSVLAAIALVVTTIAVNRSCMWFLGQDEMPKHSEKLRKF
ncbi:MAG: cyclic lactone autoinducer peptide [Candidatus Galacturonibacter soehngenii]|nr:cyclic lactone autoinducer peptide [Candidatus Galacturonibacter soehngenii]